MSQAMKMMAVGYFTQTDFLLSMGLLLFAHASFDRMMGYGLKYDDHFKHTSLGWLPEGKKKAHLSPDRPL